MLRNTFCHIQGVGVQTERKLWDAGVRRWEDACDVASLPLRGRRALSITRRAEESIRRLSRRDVNWFYSGLPACEQWRLFPEFRNCIAYVDIETTGLGGPYDYVTTAALYDGRTVRHYVHGDNLEDLREDLRDYRLVVTYNGKQFDGPFLRDYLGAHLPRAHIDLRYVLASLGCRGGLKGCEKQLGIERGELEGVDGYFAVVLWQEFRRRDDACALETLLAYNIADTVNLERLMVMSYNRKARAVGFGETHSVPLPEPPPCPFRADRDTVLRLRRDGYGTHALRDSQQNSC